MNERPEPFIFRILPFLGTAEKAFLIGTSVGVALFLAKLSSGSIAQVSLGGLAVIYFLSSFKRIDVPITDDQPFEFKELLTWTIVPKTLWIGSAFSLIGILFYSLQLGHEGYMRAVMPGGIVILFGSLIVLYSSLTGTKHLSLLIPIFQRAIPIMLGAFYVIWVTIESHN